MTQPQKNTALAFAIVAGLISLPMTWMTIRGASIQGNLGDMLNLAFGGMSINVTGLNGSITFLFKTPIWFIVGVSIAASVLQLMRGSKMFAIPLVAEWATSIAAVGWTVIAVLVALFSGNASLGIGCVLGLTSAVIPIVCLAASSSQSHVPDSRNSDKTIA